jgi:hypothetical protein
MAGALVVATGAAAAPAAAGTQTTATYFIFPTVSTHNANGMWVIGYHGTYTVADTTSGATVTTNSPIPLASDAVW